MDKMNTRSPGRHNQHNRPYRPDVTVGIVLMPLQSGTLNEINQLPDWANG